MGDFYERCKDEIKYLRVLIRCNICGNCFHRGCVNIYKKSCVQKRVAKVL